MTSGMEHTIEVRGTRIRLLRGGKGPPLVFLRGASGHVEWLPFLERLSRSFDVLAPEHPGFGSSDDPPGSIAPATLPISISISWRGWIAAELSVRNTARLASLTLGCAVGISLDGMTMGDVFRMSPEENARRFYVDAERAKARLERLASADPQILVRNRSMVVRLGYPRFLNPDLAKWLHRIDVPTLLLWGEADGLVPVVFGEAYRRVIPGAQLVIYLQPDTRLSRSSPMRFSLVLRSSYRIEVLRRSAARRDPHH